MIPKNKDPLDNLEEIITIKLGNDKFKLVSDKSIPKDEMWFVSADNNRIRKVKIESKVKEVKCE